MVNLFLTHSDYNKSAKNLDNRRLGKQRVEALQILNIINDLYLLSEYYKKPIPKNPYNVKAWIRTLVKMYKNDDFYFFIHQNEVLEIDKTDIPKAKSTDKIEIDSDGNVTITRGKKKLFFQHGTIQLPSDRIVKLGFVYHPAILMFIKHIDSLKLYINAHINEWIRRGYKNTMELYNVKTTEQPIFTYDETFHQNHKASLCTKEILNREKTWYVEKKDFLEAYEYYKNGKIKPNKTTGDFKYYIWPYNVKDGRYPEK